jgi:3',5'-cyclic-AMP phosphodiesterase
MLIAHISDLHIIDGSHPQGLVRGDAVARAHALVADLSALDPAPDFVVITGDTVNDARAEEYEVLAEVLSGLGVPFMALPGNHDDRALLRAVVSGSDYPDPVLLNQHWQQGHVRIFGLDTLSPGEVGGRLNAPQLDWLEERLSAAFDGQTLIALHHPPCAPRMGRLDRAILIEGAQRLHALAERQPIPVTFLCGHMHRPFSALWGRSLVSAATSTAFQFTLAIDAPEEPPVCADPFQYAIHCLGSDGSHVIHRRFPGL